MGEGGGREAGGICNRRGGSTGGVQAQNASSLLAVHDEALDHLRTPNRGGGEGGEGGGVVGNVGGNITRNRGWWGGETQE